MFQFPSQREREGVVDMVDIGCGGGDRIVAKGAEVVRIPRDVDRMSFFFLGQLDSKKIMFFQTIRARHSFPPRPPLPARRFGVNTLRIFRMSHST